MNGATEQKNDINTNQENSTFLEDKKIFTIDDLLDRIGFNKYHVIMTTIVSLSLISDGAEIYLIYLISPIFKEIYHIDDNVSSIIFSAFSLGAAIGSILSSVTIKLYGRRIPLLISLCFISFFGSICIVVNNIYFFIFCRFIIGICVGILFNFPNALCEILPSNYRDFIMGSIYFFVKLGIVYFTTVYYVVSSYTDPKESYKLILWINNIPMYLALILGLFFYDESPRLLLCNNKIDEAFVILGKIAGKYSITNHEKENVIKNTIPPNQTDIFTYLKQLISKKYIRIFILITFLLTINLYIIFTNNYSLPLILKDLNKVNTNNEFNTTYINNTISNEIKNKQNDHENVEKILISQIIPLPAEIVAGLMTSMALFGRINTIIIGFLAEFVFSYFMILYPNSLYIYSSLITFFNVLSFNITRLYTCEVFKTNIRDTAIGISSFISKILSIKNFII